MVEMMVDESICKLIAVREGLPLDFVAKEFYLMDLFVHMGKSGALNKLIFKGGTALNKVYLGSASRFSEDLDFDFIGKDLQEILGGLERTPVGFEATETRRILGNTITQIDFLYITQWGKKDRLRLDINVKPYAKTTEPLQVKEIASKFAGSTAFQITIYGLEDLLVRKMSALRDRTEGKDIFDVSNAIDMADSKKLLRAIQNYTHHNGVSASDFLKDIVNKLRKADYKKLRNLTNPYIPLNNRPNDWKILSDTLAMKLEMLEKPMNK